MEAVRNIRISESQTEERLLWRKFKDGDKTAYSYFYSTYASLLFRYGCKLMCDRELVKDCLHDLFTDLWRNKAGLGEPESIKNYLVKSMRNKLVRELGRQTKFVSTEEVIQEGSLGEVISHELSLINQQSKTVQEVRLIQALKKLTSKQKEIIFLIYYNNLSPVEAAAIMSVSVRTIYNTTFNAIQALKSEMVVPVLLAVIFL
ncbi:RNA polymerase sigma factor [Pedobacter sp. SYSU D00535]|uniref:RNA polymerase sigma factor n=1 Tax=Pedobacter sp. SYSU D00535 TaxID=2810308 RepID=UPI001A97B2AB|nr:sigma-70 family RNA polymerase sigma factor [Pedobacter sp. SYSU D00535]